MLHLSADAAYNRVAAARAVRRFPVILDHLAAGFLNVTTVKVLRPVLTRGNHRAILAEAKFRTRKECDLIVARLKPKPDVPFSIRPVVVPATPSPALAFDGEDAPAQAPLAPPPPPRPLSSPLPPRPIVAPLTPERFRVEMSVWKHTRDKLHRVQNLLCRELPDGDVGEIFDRALDALIRELERDKRAATSRPRTARAVREGSRHVPSHVARAVWARDGERCAFIGTGGRCTETRYLELHHVEPYARGGLATVENISVRCRAHNLYEGDLIFGAFTPVVGETRETYVVSGETRAVLERKILENAVPASAWRRTREALPTNARADRRYRLDSGASLRDT